MARAARKKLTARQRGYASKVEIAAALRDMAQRIEQNSSGDLIKFNINLWYTEDDELPQEDMTATTQPAGGEG